MIVRLAVLLIVAPIMGACAVDVRDFNREPHMTPVGSGMVPKRVSMITEAAPQNVYRGNSSIWQDSRADLFSDMRARRIGDTVTVRISIKDKASIANDSERKRDASNELGFDYSYDFASTGGAVGGQGAFDIGTGSKTRTKSEGGIERSEKIELLVAAVVSDVLPNGNLVISGSQEVRVNFEMRILNVAGIIRPLDISADNSIAYEKIAEARIAYGGRGRLMEVQQPPWGQQLVDNISPF